MTIHINFNPEKNISDFVAELIYAMKYHKKKYGQYMPPVWSVNSRADEIESIIFQIFDEIEAKNYSFEINSLPSDDDLREAAQSIWKDYQANKESYKLENIEIKIPKPIKIFLP